MIENRERTKAVDRTNRHPTITGDAPHSRVTEGGFIAGAAAARPQRGLAASPSGPTRYTGRPAASEHTEHLLEAEEELPVLLGDVLLKELLERVDALARDAAVDGVSQVRSGLGSGLGCGLGLA